MSDYPMEKIKDYHENDVLFGRGGGTNNHVGNARWRELVASCKEVYMSVPKWQKMNVSKSIVRAVRSQQPPGRFLQKDEKTNLYYDVGDRKAADKTSQALREGGPELRLQNAENSETADDNVSPSQIAESSGSSSTLDPTLEQMAAQSIAIPPAARRLEGTITNTRQEESEINAALQSGLIDYLVQQQQWDNQQRQLRLETIYDLNDLNFNNRFQNPLLNRSTQTEGNTQGQRSLGFFGRSPYPGHLFQNSRPLMGSLFPPSPAASAIAQQHRELLTQHRLATSQQALFACFDEQNSRARTASAMSNATDGRIPGGRINEDLRTYPPKKRSLPSNDRRKDSASKMTRRPNQSHIDEVVEGKSEDLEEDSKPRAASNPNDEKKKNDEEKSDPLSLRARAPATNSPIETSHTSEINRIPDPPSSCAYEIYLKDELAASLGASVQPQTCTSSAAVPVRETPLDSSRIDLGDLTRQIENRWRNASPNTIQKYWSLVDKDMDRFRIEMARYHMREAARWRDQVVDQSLLSDSLSR